MNTNKQTKQEIIKETLINLKSKGLLNENSIKEFLKEAPIKKEFVKKPSFSKNVFRKELALFCNKFINEKNAESIMAEVLKEYSMQMETAEDFQ